MPIFEFHLRFFTPGNVSSSYSLWTKGSYPLYFNPMGASFWVSIQLNSIWRRRVRAWALFGWANMKSSMWIFISANPLCPGGLKWWFTSSLWLFLPIEPACALNHLCKVSPVCPTYCLVHRVHVMRYIRLLLRRVTSFLHWYSQPVCELTILIYLKWARIGISCFCIYLQNHSGEFSSWVFLLVLAI